ncbi:chitin synthase 1, chs-1 [Ditylenchus destructor]|uniref:Chitin synthase 1, chs-1 n=1 Tax=Ditylenchus destructor TaxID=166010 RepID=A0AAD4MVC3_9BILA|nr:chitin synthase 1, chs-1 [Ditylenchus destructor]
MNINLALPSRSEWDVFRSKSRVLRAKKQDVFYIHWLQRIKLLIFFVSQCSCLAATLLSKTIVLLLATNIGMQTFVGSDVFYKKCSPSTSMQTFEKLSCFSAALWLIQITPDICAFLQDVWYINSSNEFNDSLMLTVVILECFRATGLSMLTMMVFPLLDVPRCILIMCAIPFIPHLQRSIRLVKSLCDTSRSFCLGFWADLVADCIFSGFLFIIYCIVHMANHGWTVRFRTNACIAAVVRPVCNWLLGKLGG